MKIDGKCLIDLIRSCRNKVQIVRSLGCLSCIHLRSNVLLGPLAFPDPHVKPNSNKFDPFQSEAARE
jgi:hypothetical protein